MSATFKALSLLLTYPSEDLQRGVQEFEGTLDADGLLDPVERAGLGRLIGSLATDDLYDLQERYVLLFDRTRTLSLHLFEHVHGESRDRGQALVDLQALYASHGLTIDASELPDYLPLFLEFLSTRPVAEARTLLAQPLHVLTALRERLERNESDYSAVFAALEKLADGDAEAEALAEARAQPDDNPNDLAALDRAWEDTPVEFGPDAAPGGGCPMAESVIQRFEAGEVPDTAGTGKESRP